MRKSTEAAEVRFGKRGTWFVRYDQSPRARSVAKVASTRRRDAGTPGKAVYAFVQDTRIASCVVVWTYDAMVKRSCRAAMSTVPIMRPLYQKHTSTSK